MLKHTRILVVLFVLLLVGCKSPERPNSVNHQPKASESPESLPKDSGDAEALDDIIIAPANTELPNVSQIEKTKTVQFENTDSVAQKGTLTYNYDDTMMVGKSQIVELKIRKGIYLSKKVDSILHRETVQVSSTMKFTLESDDSEAFDIKSYSTDIQVVDSSQWTIWNWRIRASKSGEYFLNLKGVVKNHLGFRDVPIFHKKIIVVARPKQVWYVQHNLPEQISQGDYVDVDVLVTKTHKIGRLKLRAEGNTDFELRLKPSNLIKQETLTKTIYLNGDNDNHFSFGFRVENPKKIIAELYATNLKNTQRVFKDKVKVKKSVFYSIKKVFSDWQAITGIMTALFIPVFLYLRKVRILRRKLAVCARDLETLKTLNNKGIELHIVEQVNVRLDYLKAESNSSAIKSRVDIIKLMLGRIQDVDDVKNESVHIDSYIKWFKTKRKYLFFAIIL